MTTITNQKYQDHECIETIEYCLEQAIQGNSLIPDYCLTIEGMSGLIYRKFINNFMRSIENPRYLEIGSWRGSTFCAAIGGVEGVEALSVDNFSHPGGSMDAIKENVEKCKSATAKIEILDQNFDDFDFTAHGKFNVYMYDAWHSEEAQRDAIIRVVPALEEISLIVVDDWNDHGYTTPVKIGTYAGFEQSGLEILYKFEVETGTNPPFPSEWHNGYAVFLVKKKV